MPEHAVVDLRSDTVTRPTPEMRRAMAEAEVGDDVLGDDPTVRRLEATVAGMLAKDAALFFPSGIMANQTALAAWAPPGTEVIVEAGAHILHWEEAAASTLSGLQLRPVASEGGLLGPADVRAAIRPDSRYQPRTALLALENTHLASGGRVLSPERTDALGAVAREAGLPVHLDGARLWHAAVATGRPVSEFARAADTVMVALSKGLGAPVGSVLAGPGDLIERAWRVRRRFGGAMRQSGILAAAGLYALEHHLEGLAADHERARTLADAFARSPGVRVGSPETNVVLVEVDPAMASAEELLSFLRDRRILISEFGLSTLRAVTHRDVDSRGITRVLDVLEEWRERSKA